MLIAELMAQCSIRSRYSEGELTQNFPVWKKCAFFMLKCLKIDA